MSLEIYKEKLSFSLGRWLGGDQSVRRMIGLASLLDCPLMGDTRVAALPVPPGEECKRLVGRTWFTILRTYKVHDITAAVKEIYIVAGMLQEDRWKELLRTEQGAREWVCLVSRFLSYCESGRDEDLLAENAARIEVEDVLRRELRGSIGACFDDSDDARDIAQTLFGEAWCVLIFDGRAKNVSLADLIVATSPSFMPGILSFDTEQIEQDLPGFL